MKLLIVDDHPVVLNGTKALLEQYEQWSIDAESNPLFAVERIRKGTYDCCLLDVNMQPLNGIQLAEEIRHASPDTCIILYTGYDLADYFGLILARKVDGLLSKTATKEQVAHTISAALRGDVLLPGAFLDFVSSKLTKTQDASEAKLNDKELRILHLVAQGATNKAIAAELGVSQRTVENYLTKIFTALQVESRAEAVNKAKDDGLLD
ncbi:MAG: response regulator [Lysinibacillus sp.]